jgi:hypothetical protein
MCCSAAALRRSRLDGREAMKLTITVPDEIAEELRHRPDPERLAGEAIAQALARVDRLDASGAQGGARWQRIVERVRRTGTVPGLREHLEQQRREFRNEFRMRGYEP